MKTKNIFLFLLMTACCFQGYAQKKRLTMEDYKLWKRVDAQNMSEDGKWVTYQFTFIDSDCNPKDPTTFLYNTVTRETRELPRVTRPNFFAGGKWLKYTVMKPEADTTGMQDSTFLLRLRDMKKIYWNRKYDFSESSGCHLVTYTYKLSEEKDAPKRLVCWNIETGDTVAIDSIGDYKLLDKGKNVLYVKEGILYYGPLKGRHAVLFNDAKAFVTDFTLQPQNAEGSFVAASDTSRIKNPDLLYVFSLRDGTVRFLLDYTKIGIPKQYIARNRPYRLSNGGNRVIIDVDTISSRRRKREERPDTSFELELWTWNDEVSSLQQSKSSYNPSNVKFAYDVERRKCYRITTQNMEKLILPASTYYDYAFAVDRGPYKRFADWKSDVNADIYLIDLNTGEARVLEKDFETEPVWSPNGKYAVLYHAKEKAWYKVDPKTGKQENISKAIGHPVHNELHDLPKPADPYGIAGWTADGDRVILYDRYDLWVVDLTGKTKTYCLTKGYGRETQRTFRWLKRDYDEKIIDLKKDLLLEFTKVDNGDQGIYRFTPESKFVRLIEGPFAVNVYQLSKDGKNCIWTKQSYTEFRDLWWSRSDFKHPRRITDANPQQKNYKWGNVRLVKWNNFEGKENAGLLYLPENYDSTKTYPTIVNFYETHSGELHNYIVPVLSSGMINTVTYVSNGYVVFMPDVHFTVGNPGESSYNAVVSGTQMLIDRGIADKDRIGIQGHSWSGYQVAYLVTRTNMFKCASPGAAVSSMISAYTGIRTGSGMPRMFMYEETQSRIGKSLWEDPEIYIKHSPILYADKIQTPLLIFHCDADEAVPYAEGLNLFLAMRRLQKPAWLLNYKGERHFLYNKAAERDWTFRMQQFFDHYLKGLPMPRWMKEGIHVNERGIDQKYNYGSFY